MNEACIWQYIFLGEVGDIILRQCGFFKQLLVQNELIFNLWMKRMKPEFDNTFS